MTRAKFIFIYVTCPTLAVAKKIARSVVDERLCACANILPSMRSIYRWQGRVHEDREVVLILKTRSARYAAVERAVRKMHPYDCPCIVALPIVHGERGYFRWLAAESR